MKNKCLFEKYFLSSVSIFTIRLPTPLFLYPMDTEKSLLAIRNTALETLSSLSLTEENMSKEKRPLLSELLKQTMVNAQKNLIAAFCLERYVEEEQKHATYVAELEKFFNDNETDANATGLLCKYERKRKMYNDVRDVVTRLSDIVDETNRSSDAITAIEFKPIFDGIAEMRRKYVRSFEEDTILCAAQNNESADMTEKFNSIEAQHRLWLQEYTDFMTTIMDWDDVAKLEFKVLQMHAKRNDIDVAFEELLAEQSQGEILLV